MFLLNNQVLRRVVIPAALLEKQQKGRELRFEGAIGPHCAQVESVVSLTPA